MFVSQYNWCWNCSICFLLYVLLSSHLQFFLLLKNLKCSLYSQKISKFLVVRVTRNFHLTQSTHKFLALVMHPGLFVNSQASSCFVAGTLLCVNLCIYACFSVFLQPSITNLIVLHKISQHSTSCRLPLVSLVFSSFFRFFQRGVL